MSAEQDALLVRAAIAAENVREVTADLDVARATEQDAARAAYAGGATAYRIAQVMGRSQTAIAKWVRAGDEDDPQLAKRGQTETEP